MQDQNEAPAKKLEDMKPGRDLATMPDQKIDMFSSRGFALAQRIAQAFSTSDAVPAIFQSQVPKKVKGEIVAWIENPAAFGNCLVAIETAQAVGMSITAVMQNANVIEGKLSWSGKFIIAAVNASRRFTPLRFDVQNRGMMKANYKEKLGWNKEENRYNMADRTVELENIECVAWALPYGMEFPHGVYTLAQAKAAGLPVIVGPKVSMKLAVEEGWYAKSGSKWQTDMKDLMIMYRSGAYFGNIHAPDVVMGMGRTTEEMQDMGTIDVQQQPNGQYAATSLDELRTPAPKEDKHPHAETVEVRDNQPEAEPEPAAEPKEEARPEPKEPITPEVSALYEQVAGMLHKAASLNQLADASEQIGEVGHKELRAQLAVIYKQRLTEFQQIAKDFAPAQEEAKTKRTKRGAGPAAE